MSVQELKKAQRKLVNFSQFFGYHLLVALLVVQLAIPPFAYAGPGDESKPSGTTTTVQTTGADESNALPLPISLPSFRGAMPKTESAQIISDQSKRNAVIGLSPEQAFIDIYFTGPEVQWGEVAEYERTNKAVSDDNGIVELSETDANGVSALVRYKVSVTRFEPGKLNETFTSAPRSYALDSDVEVEVKNGQLIASLEVKHKSGKRVFRRCISVPGIQSVLVNSAFIHILLANGELKTLLGSHNRLFQFNELAGGGALLLATTSVLTDSKHYDSKGRLKPEIALRNHDSRDQTVVYGKGFTAETIARIRYADLEVTGVEDGSLKVVDLIPLSGIAAVADGHMQLLQVRQDLLSGATPFKSLMDGAEQARELGSQHPELLPFGNDVSGLINLISQPGLSATFRRTARPWEKQPFEMPVFGSKNLDQLTQFIQALGRVASNPTNRASHPGASPDIVADPETPEGRLATDAKVLLENAQLLALKATHLGWAGRFFKKHQSLALIMASLAAVQSIIYYMPNSPMFLQSKLFNIDLAIPAINFPLGEWGTLATNRIPLQLEGPAVPYILKFWLMAGTITMGTFVALPLSFAYFSERVLGRKLPRGFEVGMKQTLESGWEVFTTFGLRLGSYLLISWRDSVARLTAGIPATARKIPYIGWLLGGILRIDGPPNILQAMRYGQSPVEFLTHQAPEAPRSWWSRTKGVFGKIRSASGTDPSEVQSGKEAMDMAAYQISLMSLLAALGQQNLVKHDGPVDSLVLRRELGEEKYLILEQRFKILVALIRKALDSMPSAQVSADLPELAKTVFGQNDIEKMLKNPLAPLTIEEQKLLASAKMRITMSRFWPKAAGNNDIFFRFRDGEATRGNVTVWSQNFRNDIGTHPLWMGSTPGDDAFASAANPGNLLFSDQSPGLLGLAGTRGTVEMVVNLLAWISNIPTDELTYGNRVAVGVPEDHLNPGRIVDGRNPIFRAVRDRNPASLFSSMASYSTWLLPWHADFWTSSERLAYRITNDQLRTWKNFLISGTLLTFLGLMMEWGSLKPEQQVMGVAFLAATAKTLLFNSYAYAFYRFFWMGHSIGVRNNTIEPNNHAVELTALVLDARDALLNGIAGDNSRLESDYQKIVSFFAKHGKSLPPEISSLQDPRERLEQASVYAVAVPPMVTSVHGFAGTATNQVMTVITTVIGTFGSALCWKYAFDTSWVTVGGILGGLYGLAHVVGFVSSNLRAGLTYNTGVANLRTAIEQAKEDPSQANRDNLFAAILRVVKVYERYGKGGAFDGRGLEVLNSNSDLVAIGSAVYQTAVEKPPVNNSMTRRSTGRERATQFCASVMAENASEQTATAVGH